jgi:hypothetical protein
MADKYASLAGGGAHDGTSEANAWTFAEAIAAPVAAGDIVHFQISASYTTGSVTLPTGTMAAPIIFRAYNSTINDLNNNGLNADGTVNTTNFSTLTVTGLITPGPYCFLENFIVTGAISARLIGSGTVDNFGATQCTFTNTQNNASAGCVQGDAGLRFTRCSFACTGAAHIDVVTCAEGAVFTDCRFTGTESGEDLVAIDGTGTFTRCVFTGTGLIGIRVTTSNGVPFVANCTFYSLGTGIQWANVGHVRVAVLLDNHVTDCTEWLESLTAGNIAVIELGTRTRNNTTPRQQIGTVLAVRNEVTTDTGGAATDYTNAGSADFTLISGAPGRTAGFIRNADIGAFQMATAAGATGSVGLLTTFDPGMLPSTELSSTHVLDAANEVLAVVFQASAAGDIDRVKMYISAIGGTGGTYDVRIETVDATTGEPTGTLFGTNTNLSAAYTTTGIKTVTLTAAATVAAGDNFAVVIKAVTADGTNKATFVCGIGPCDARHPYFLTGTTAAYVKSLLLPSVITPLYDDDTTVAGTFPLAGDIDNESWDSTSTSNQDRGNAFTFPMAVRVMGFRLCGGPVEDGANFTVSVYNSAGTAQQTRTYDEDIMSGRTSGDEGLIVGYFDTPYTVPANTKFYIAMRPTAAADVRMQKYTFMSATDRANVFPIGNGATRNNTSGIFNIESTDVVYPIFPIIDQVEIGEGGAGTIIIEESMQIIPLNNTTIPLCFNMRDSAGDFVTGLSPTVTLSKNGGAFASPSGAVSEIGSTGKYIVAANATDANTAGSLKLNATGTGAIPESREFHIASSATVPTAAENADAVWDEALSGHTTAGSAGKAVTDIEADADAILVDTADMQPKIPPARWVSGTVGATVTSTTVFQVDVSLDTAANSHKFMELTLIRASGVKERQRILSHTRVDANTITVTLANALSAVPTTGDAVVME